MGFGAFVFYIRVQYMHVQTRGQFVVLHAFMNKHIDYQRKTSVWCTTKITVDVFFFFHLWNDCLHRLRGCVYVQYVANMCNSYLETHKASVTVLAFRKAPSVEVFYSFSPDRVNLQSAKALLQPTKTLGVWSFCVCTAFSSPLLKGHRVVCFL